MQFPLHHSISNHPLSESYSYCYIPNVADNLKGALVFVEERIPSGETKVVVLTDVKRKFNPIKGFTSLGNFSLLFLS